MMTYPQAKNGAPRMAGTLAVVFAVPFFLLMGLITSYQRASAQQNDQAPTSQAPTSQAPTRQTSAPEAPTPEASTSIPAPSQSQRTRPAARTVAPSNPATLLPGQRVTTYQPRTQIVYETRQKTVNYPSFDPATGKTTMKSREERYTVPVGTTVYTAVGHRAHDPKVMQLAAKLRELNEDAPDYEKTRTQLEELLEKEFDDNHKQQRDEIERTAKRLDALRSMLQSREENKKRIVQRRIDQLTGEPDALQWNPGTVTPGPRSVAPGPSSFGPAPRSSSPLYSRHNKSGQVATLQIENGPRSNFAVRPQLPAGVYANPTQPANVPGVPIASAPRAINTTQPSALSPIAQLPPVSSRQTNTSTSNPIEPLRSAQRLSNALLAEKAAESELKRAAMLADRKALPMSELRSTELKLEKARRDSAFAKAEWEAMIQRLQSEIVFAKGVSQRAELKHRAAKIGYESGDTNRATLTEAQDVLARAEKTVEDLTSLVDQYKKARELIGDDLKESDNQESPFGDDDADEDGEDDGSGDVDEKDPFS